MSHCVDYSSLLVSLWLEYLKVSNSSYSTSLVFPYKIYNSYTSTKNPAGILIGIGQILEIILEKLTSLLSLLSLFIYLDLL